MSINLSTSQSRKHSKCKFWDSSGESDGLRAGLIVATGAVFTLRVGTTVEFAGLLLPAAEIETIISNTFNKMLIISIIAKFLGLNNEFLKLGNSDFGTLSSGPVSFVSIIEEIDMIKNWTYKSSLLLSNRKIFIATPRLTIPEIKIAPPRIPLFGI